MRARPRRQALVTLVVCTLLVGLTLAAVPASAAALTMSPPSHQSTAARAVTAGRVAATQADTTIDATARVALTPAEPGTVRVDLTFALPTQVTDLVVSLPEQATVTDTSGFEETSDGYEWHGGGDPTLTYDLSVNRSRTAEGPLTGDGQYSFVDAGAWALVRKPGFDARWKWRGSPNVTLERSVTTAGRGAVGDTMVYLGPYEEYDRVAHDQRFRLLVPAAADLSASPDAILASLANASDELRVGDRDDEVFAVAAPTGTVGWTARGLQTGDADFWVRDREGLATADNVWLHEYVHTRQAFSRDATISARWLTEGMANYYAALLTLDRGEIGFESFSRELELGRESRYDDSVLAAPETWARYTDYEKGALVTGELDRRIRLATGRVNSFQNVWAQLNSAEDPVDQATLRAAIRTTTNESVASQLSDLVTSRSIPSMWTREQHRAAFGATPALMRTTVPADETGYRISGPFRNRSTPQVLTLVPGETLAFAVGIENVGGRTGEYTLPVRRDGTTITTLTGSVAARARTNRTVEYSVTEPGRWTLSVGDSTLVVSATAPATPRVTAVGTDPAAPTAGEETFLTATVRNDAAVPGERTLTFVVDGQPLSNRTVRLDAHSTREIAVPATLEAGSHRLSTGNSSVDFEVAPAPTSTEDAAGTTSARAGPGFAVTGALAALAALTALALLGRLRRRS